MSASRSRMAVLLVPVPEGATTDGEVGVTQVQELGSTIDYLPVVRQVQPPHVTARELVVPQRPPPGPPEGMSDLRPFKKHVALLPSNHPLRFALLGEPDWMAPAELRLKLREWAKYLAWQER